MSSSTKTSSTNNTEETKKNKLLQDTLVKSKESIVDIKQKLQPVLQRLKDDEFGTRTDQAHATVALSIGMVRYMGARLQGLDQGRQSDDPLRKELNNMKRVLAEIKKRTPVSTATTTTTTTTTQSTSKIGDKTTTSANDRSANITTSPDDSKRKLEAAADTVKENSSEKKNATAVDDTSPEPKSKKRRQQR